MENNIPAQVCSSSSLQSFSVIQFRGQEPIDHDTDEYHKVLKDAGVGEVDRIPVLSFEFKNLPILKQQLLEEGSFTGIILTSPRAVEAVQECLIDEEEILRLKGMWCDKDIFCVGPKTAEEARSRLGLRSALDPELIGDGHKLGVQIVSFLQERSQLKGKLLLPCSTIAKMHSVEELEAAGVEVVVSFVYETTSFPDAPERLRKGVQKASGSVVFLVMFSPSNFKAILPELRRLMAERDVRVIAIGPTSKKAIEEAGVPVWSTCPSPTPVGLLRALHERLE